MRYANNQLFKAYNSLNHTLQKINIVTSTFQVLNYKSKNQNLKVAVQARVKNRMLKKSFIFLQMISFQFALMIGYYDVYRFR